MNAHISGTLSSAARVIMKALGADKVAEIVRRSPGLVYKWSDTMLHCFPNLYQAVEIDAVFVSEGLGPPPLFIAYANLLRGAASADKQSRHEVRPNAVKIMNLACKILAEVSTEAASAAAPSNETPPKWRRIAQDLRELNDLVTAARWSLGSDPGELISTPIQKTLLKKTEGAVCH